jgi:hypothetical protein
MQDASRELALEGALLALYNEWAALPLRSSKTYRLNTKTINNQLFSPARVRNRGGIEAVRHVMSKATGGLSKLEGHLDLTVESRIVLSGKWDDLFDDADREQARNNIATLKSQEPLNSASG